jgi:DNA-directed RNA polymerase specialized sigma24 family protein
MRTASSYDESRPFQGWCTVVAKRMIRDKRCTLEKKTPHVAIGDAELFAFDPAPLADDQIAAEEVVRHFDAEDAGLILLLTDGYQIDELPPKLGVTFGRARGRVRRLRQRIRGLLARQSAADRRRGI